MVIQLSSYKVVAFHFVALPVGDKHAFKPMALRSSKIVCNKGDIANWHMTDLQPSTVKCKKKTEKEGHKNSLCIRHLKSVSIPAKAI